MITKFISESEDLTGALSIRPPNSRQRILVVEDDALIRRLNTEVLTYSGYQVDTAEDGAIAWSAIQRENYDLIVTDNNMPNMTGIDLVQLLHETRMSLPVIMATSTFPQDDLDRHPWLQIEAILLKPYTFHELLATVQDVLSANPGHLGESAPPNWRSQPVPSRLSI
jgi:DNA-binding response OmpR family regulator